MLIQFDYKHYELDLQRTAKLVVDYDKEFEHLLFQGLNH